MAPTYKLTYFDGRGIAEPIRYLLKYGNIDFEDVRITKEEWPRYKDSTPYGKLPVLEKDGVQIAETVPICRYIANLVNLAGKDAWENLQIDSIIEAFLTIRPKLYDLQATQDPAEKKARLDELVNELLPFYLDKLEAATKKNNGYLVLGRLTWADVFVVSFFPNIDRLINVDILKNYPSIQALIETVNAIPPIKSWIEIRPVTAF